MESAPYPIRHMAQRFVKTLMTPQVLAAQQHYYGRTSQFSEAPARDSLTEEERAFIATRDSFYLATISESGWPYVQHRGGPPGFLQMLDAQRLVFADYGGNRQMLSTGNLATNDRVTLFLMDYPRRERLKVLGHARVLDAREHLDLVQRVHPPEFTQAKPERVFVVDVLSFDWNCPKFITPRYTTEEVETVVEPLRRRIAELEQQLAKRAD